MFLQFGVNRIFLAVQCEQIMISMKTTALDTLKCEFKERILTKTQFTVIFYNPLFKFYFNKLRSFKYFVSKNIKISQLNFYSKNELIKFVNLDLSYQ